MTSTITGATWNCTDLELYAVWRPLADDMFLPWPLRFITDIPSEDEFRRACRDAVEQVRQRYGTSLEEVLDTLGNNDIHLSAFGDGERKGDPAQPELLRIFAVRRKDRGFVFVQTPTGPGPNSTRITIEEVEAIRLADAVAEKLPDAPAGRQGEVVLPSRTPSAEYDYTMGDSLVRDSFTVSVHSRGAQFLDTPGAGTGFIDVVQGRSLFGPRGRAQFRLQWRDLPDDGRYLIDDQDPPTARPADRTQTISAINNRIAQIVRIIKDESASGSR